MEWWQELQEMSSTLLSFLVFGPYGNITMAAFFDNKSPSVADAIGSPSVANAIGSVGLEIDSWVMAGAWCKVVLALPAT
jgi:hypothetical protein